ncbi:MAG: GDSL family lipase [Nitrospirae bacterium]|nr:GDSL family lipase [Nitrospirota bacterium]
MNILFLGHSLIEFFDWQKRFPGYTVRNLGVAGESVEGLLSRLDRIKKTYPEADLIFIMTGLNNIAMEDFDFLDSYREIITKLSVAYPKANMFIHSLLPVLVDFISNESILNVNDSIKALAGEMRVEFMDVHKLFIDYQGKPVKDYLLDDGVHLSDEGYNVWSGALEAIINRYAGTSGK